MRGDHIRFGALSGTLALGLAAALTGCGADIADSGSDDGYTIGFVSSANNEWGTCLVNGVKAAAEKEGVDLKLAYSNADPAKEVANLEDLISQQVDAIVLNTVSVDALAGGIQKAKAADIPLYLTAVVPESMDEVLGATVVDLGNVGSLAAGWITEDSAGKVTTVGVIAGAPGASSDMVVKGFTGALPATAEVVAEQPGMFNRAKAQEVAENMIEAHPDLGYVLVLNEDMAFGARAAFDAAGRKDLKIVTVNGTDPGLEAVTAGQFSATVSDPAAELGASSIEKAVALLEESAPEKLYKMPVALITPDNVEEAAPFCSA